ncbi:MAG: polysaccharide deacetylase family protein, partial [Solirubrobacteraceae bacterium]
MLLTFDDGPDSKWTPRVLRALGKTRATFFMLGPAARARGQLVEEVLGRGHAVGLHGSGHLRHSELTADALRRDTYAALDDLDAVGVRPTQWRTPWGVVTDDTRALADELELELVGWSVDT